MTFLPKRPIASIALNAFLILILVVLAALQYRWSGQISEAAHARMQASLETSMFHFRQQYYSELQQLTFSFQPDAAIQMQRDWKSYAENCSAILSGPDGNLVRDVYLWIATKDGGSTLLHLNQRLTDFEPIAWPSRLNPVKERYAAAFLDSSPPFSDNPRFGWTMFSQIPLLLRPLLENRSLSDAPGDQSRPMSFLMIELDKENIKSTLLPEIAHRAFRDPEGFNYYVAVVDEFSGAIVYRSDSALTPEALAQPDVKINLMEEPRERMDMRAPGSEMRPPEQRDLRAPMSSMPPPPFRQPGRGIGPISVEAEGAGWTLVAKHREGSLDVAVARLRRRNLAISFGGLLLLAASMALILINARRAQRLARLQLEFVAGISHELRTPLAVICSAGDNLAEGVIGDSSQSTKKYGELIRGEGRKLAGMIERILQFAGLQRGLRRYNLRPLQINDITESALKQAETAIASAGFSVETSFAPGLPTVSADPDALSQAIQNLIQNALKYSGARRRLAVRTGEAADKRGSEVWLAVEDQGIGIDKEDLAHIFEPFFRGKMALSEQIHGTGLGLYLVRETLASMGAKISVKSAPGKGSRFTIHFAAAPGSSGQASSA